MPDPNPQPATAAPLTDPPLPAASPVPGTRPGPGGDPREAISYAELRTRAIPPLKPLVEGLLDEATGAILAGPPGLGKTWLILRLARAVTSGTPWLGHLPTRQAPVLIFDEEGNLPGMQARIKMLEAADPRGEALPITFCVGHGVRLDRQEGLTHVATMIARYRPGLTLFDSLTRMHSRDENSAGEMADLFGVATTRMRVYGPAILFTDHLRKKSLINDPAEMLRGSSEKRAWPESILFTAAGEAETTIHLVHITSRYHQPLEPFRVTLAVDEAAGTAALTYAGGVAAQTATKANAIIAAIHDLQRQLGDDGAAATTVAAWLACSPETVRRHIRKLVAAGLIATRKVAPSGHGGKPQEVYDVTGRRD